MNTEIKEWINQQREKIDEYYDLPPEEKRKMEAMLERLERLGSRCRTEAEFKRKFTTLTMYQDFNCMLLDFSCYIRPEIIQTLKYPNTL